MSISAVALPHSPWQAWHDVLTVYSRYFPLTQWAAWTLRVHARGP